jgi:polyhydroxybutyrate depolymerase
MNRSAISIAVVTLLAYSVSCSSNGGAQTPAMTQAGAPQPSAAGQSGQTAPTQAGGSTSTPPVAGTAAGRAGTTGAAAASGGTAASGSAAGAAATAGGPAAAGTTASAGTAAPAAGSGGTAAGTAGSTAMPEPQTCPTTAALMPGDSNVMIDAGGMNRRYIRHVPPGYDGKKPVPLLIDWHPLTQTGQFQRTNSGYAAVADREGFIVLYPDGIDNAWNIGPCCTRSRMVDDLGLAKAMVAKLESEACIDKKRIYSAGYSMGGGMTHFLGCNAADIFAAIAPAAFDLLTEQEEPCKPARPITVIAFRGSADPIVPYAGGESSPPTFGYTLPPIHFLGAEGTFKRWQELNMCTGTPMDAGSGCQTVTQCAGGVETTLCTKQGGGHDTGDPEVGWKTLKRFTLP